MFVLVFVNPGALRISGAMGRLPYKLKFWDTLLLFWNNFLVSRDFAVLLEDFLEWLGRLELSVGWCGQGVNLNSGNIFVSSR